MKVYALIKKYAYAGKLFWISVFRYPATTLRDEHAIDYDAYWNAKRGDKLGTLSDWQKKRADVILSRITVPASITDIGCGDGSVLSYLQKHKSGLQAHGVDVSTVALRKAEEMGISTLKADISNPTELDRITSADYFLLLEVLEHIPHSEQFLKNILEKTKKGVFFSFPNSGFISYRLRLLFGRFPAQWKVHPGEHIRFWTARDIKWWLKAIGIKDYELFFYKGIPFLNKVLPGLFAAGMIVYVPKSDVSRQG
jgi:methionine biosynthesis protein MetW